MVDDLKKWRDDGNHLPEFMRDFHDQKDLFKAIASIPPPRESIAPMEINWMQAHMYTIDRFLWFMARHGYVLRKSTAQLQFAEIGETLKRMTNERRAGEANALRQVMQKPATG